MFVAVDANDPFKGDQLSLLPEQKKHQPVVSADKASLIRKNLTINS